MKLATITILDKAFKGAARSYELSIINDKDRLLQLLVEMKGFKINVTMKIAFKKSGINKTLYKSAYFNSKPQIIMNGTNINEPLGLISQQLRNQIGKWLSEGSGWMIELVDKHYLNIVRYTPMKGSTYIQFPKELSHQNEAGT